MITAIDTNILLDVLYPDAPFAVPTVTRLGELLEQGSLVISEPVYSELAGRFATADELESFLATTGVSLERVTAASLFLAGEAWRRYARQRRMAQTCPRCGTVQEVHCRSCGALLSPRQHILADFLIGAHASLQADQLLTRDLGYYRAYFPDLRLV